MFAHNVQRRADARAPERTGRSASDRSRDAAAPAASAWRLLSSAVLQTKLRVGAADTASEREADRIAERVTGSPEEGRAAAAAPSAAPPSVQRKCQCEEEEAQRAPRPGAAPALDALPLPIEARIDAARVGGEPLPQPLRSYFEPRFGLDFSAVRLHTGAEASQAANDLQARAFTVGRDIVLGDGEYRPDSHEGRSLLAHELAHTVQQGAVPGAAAKAAPHVARQPKQDEPAAPASPWKPGTQCDRENRENTDFPRTYIDRVSIDLGDMTSGLTLSWVNPTGLTLPTGGFAISPGAGLCCDNCDDEATSRLAHHNCTPKGSWRVHNKGCLLPGSDWARNPTYFSRAGIAIHNGEPYLPGHPASHGCVRTTEEASRIVHDNSIYSARYRADPERGLPDRRTEVVVSGTWVGRRCYHHEHDERSVERSTACAGRSSSAGDTGGLTAPPTEERPAEERLAQGMGAQEELEGPSELGA